MSVCKNCGRELDGDDIGAYRKFHDRDAADFLCVPCFCRELQCTEEFLRERIAFLKRNNCALFPPERKK